MLKSKNIKLNKKKWKLSGTQSCKKSIKICHKDNLVQEECLECLVEWVECLEEWVECLVEWVEWEVNNKIKILLHKNLKLKLLNNQNLKKWKKKNQLLIVEMNGKLKEMLHINKKTLKKL